MTNNEAAGGLLPNASSEELEKVDYSTSRWRDESFF